MTPRHADDQADLERLVLGCALLDEQAGAVVRASIAVEMFTDAKCRELAALVLAGPLDVPGARTAGVDPVLLSACTSGVGSTTRAATYCDVLAESSVARRAALYAERAASNLRSGGVDAYEAIEELQANVARVVLEAGAGIDTDAHVSHAVRKALVRLDDYRAGKATDFAPSGFDSFDRDIGGYPVGELTTIAAMTGAGKTSLLIQGVVGVAKYGKRGAVVLFSAEMSSEQIVQRAAAQMAGTDLRDLRTGRASHDAYEAHKLALESIGRLNIQVDDAAAPSFAHIEARLSLVASAGPVAMVAVDYDEKLHSEGQSEELRVSAIARGLKDLAKRHHVPVVALSQYSRGAAGNNPPANHLLRYSGKKEHESAMVVHWWWPGYWVRQGEDGGRVAGYNDLTPNRGWLLVTKNRFGPGGKVPLDFDVTTTTFSEVTEREHRTASWYEA